jgi:hypothetical protein
MQSDPRIGMAISLAVAGAAFLWLLGQWVAGDEIWTALGDATHAITLLSIFLLIAGLTVALLFLRFWQVRADLLANRYVVARWTVEPGQFRAFGEIASARDRAEKRWALLVMLGFIVLIFGAFALFDPEVAPAMLAMGVALALLMAIAFLLGQRVQRRQLRPRSREVIVGTRGVMVNDVLHVWSVPLSWLSDVSADPGPPPTLTITYAYLGRSGPQYVDVMLPLPAIGDETGETIVARLLAYRGRGVRQAKERTRRAARPSKQAD